MLKQTPFHELHIEAGAKLTNFGGFDMPVQYTSIKKEHQAVRENAGLFDVSHMGELYITGSEAADLIQYLTINDVKKLEPGKAQYTAMCYGHGGIVDDLLVYKLDEQEFMLVVNASNTRKDENWITQNNIFDAQLQNRSDNMCLLALQGPEAHNILQKLTQTDVTGIPFYSFTQGVVAGFEGVIISATGYTGEKGYELYFDQRQGKIEDIWNAFLEAGNEFNMKLCGLGARDTLRLEMGYLLYGNDISEDTNPLEAGLKWLFKPGKGTFIGRDAILKAQEEGIQNKLVGFTTEDKRSIPRTGYTIYNENEQELGFVTSGTRSITLDKNIGLGYVANEYSDVGNSVHVEIRNKKAEANIVSLPFLKKD